MGCRVASCGSCTNLVRRMLRSWRATMRPCQTVTCELWMALCVTVLHIPTFLSESGPGGVVIIGQHAGALMLGCYEHSRCPFDKALSREPGVCCCSWVDCQKLASYVAMKHARQNAQCAPNCIP